MQQLKVTAGSAEDANAVLDAFAASFDRAAFPPEAAKPVLTLYHHPDGSTTRGVEMAEESRASRMDGHWMGRKVRHGAMATSLDAFMAMIEYDGDDPSDGHASPFNPVYRRAKPKRTSGSITWKSKWIPSYRIPELESIAAAYPKCALLYTCVEQRRGFVVQINVVDGVVTDTRPEGCTASEVVQKAIAIPSIRRMWEKSG